MEKRLIYSIIHFHKHHPKAFSVKLGLFTFHFSAKSTEMFYFDLIESTFT